ncbi:DUF4062 domain-containing protein [Bacteroides xylanisolvens]|uniref:DUF4062 domain-containing protein n=1 Tax=Bacteroides xylanisolvens TaxID=371601 RepID=UPI00189B5825|nr:DUF4062 domain-containing protein [Bacteroides xylanisolvens]
MEVWKVIKIFISSTFVDMDKERDVLRHVVETQLNQCFKPHHLRIRFVDLRKDVETDTKLSQDERERQILQVCMKEIEECAPFFIGLIGDRYGWVPPQSLVAEYEHNLSDIMMSGELPSEKSVTCFEFLKGVFHQNQHSRRAALIYVRESDGGQPTDSPLALFKQFLRNNVPAESLYTYTALDSPQLLMQWAQKVVHSLTDKIKQEYHISDVAPLSEVQLMNLEQDEFVDTLTKTFVGRKQELQRIADNINQGKSLCISITQTGIGGSSLIAQSYVQTQADPTVFAIFHSCEVSSAARQREAALYRFCYLLRQRIGQPDMQALDAMRHNLDALSEEFLYLVSQVITQGYRFVLFVDNNLELDLTLYQAQKLGMIEISTVNGMDDTKNESYQLLLSKGYLFELGGMDADTIHQMLQGQRKVVKEALLKRRESSNPRWLSQVLIIIERLTGEDFVSIRSRNELDKEEQINAYLVEFIGSLGNSIASVHQRWIEKLKAVYSAELVEHVFALYSFARFGWTDEDVSRITGYSLYACISLRQGMGRFLISSNQYGLWSVTSEEFRTYWEEANAPQLSMLIEKAYEYVKHQAEDSETIEMNLFHLCWLNDRYEECIGIISQHPTADPYADFPLIDLLFRIRYEEDHGVLPENSLGAKLIAACSSTETLFYVNNWLSMLRTLGMGNYYFGLSGISIGQISCITGKEPEAMGNDWYFRYNLLAYYVDHSNQHAPNELSREVAEKCVSNIKEALLSSDNLSPDDEYALLVSLFHWVILYLPQLTSDQERLIFINNIRSLVTNGKIKLHEIAWNNYALVIMQGAEMALAAGYADRSLELCKEAIDAYSNYMMSENLSKDYRLKMEAYDNYCIAINNLFGAITELHRDPKLYKEYLTNAFGYAYEMKGKWMVDTQNYYKILLLYTQLISTADDPLVVKALDELNLRIYQSGNCKEDLSMYLTLLISRCLLHAQNHNNDAYYEDSLELFSVINQFRDTIQRNIDDFSPALIYLCYANIQHGIAVEDDIKVCIEGKKCLYWCEKEREKGEHKYEPIERIASQAVQHYWELGEIDDEVVRSTINEFIGKGEFRELHYLTHQLKSLTSIDHYNYNLYLLNAGYSKDAMECYELLWEQQENKSSAFAFSVLTNLLVACLVSENEDKYLEYYQSLEEEDKEDSDIEVIHAQYIRWKQTGEPYNGPLGYEL